MKKEKASEKEAEKPVEKSVEALTEKPQSKAEQKGDKKYRAWDQMYVWSRVETTDPDMTERVNFGAFKFTTIDAQYQIKRATELFGPCGLGWGIRNQTFDMLAIDPADPHYNLLCFTAQLWYVIEGEEGCVDIAADIELFENTKNGWKRVSDPMKKVRTDALTKGFSWLGFSADVFMGRFDDAKYVQRLQQEKRAEQMQKERQQRSGVELASHDQLETIQRLAGQANLAGADFAQWLRETYATSWSRLTASTADQVITGLNQLLGRSAA